MYEEFFNYIATRIISYFEQECDNLHDGDRFCFKLDNGELVEQVNDEICGAKNYAETYLEFKAKGNMPWANKYKEMANDELKHAMTVHEYTVQEIEELRKVYTPPVEMLEKWDLEHKKYVEEVAWVKQMLTM